MRNRLIYLGVLLTLLAASCQALPSLPVNPNPATQTSGVSVFPGASVPDVKETARAYLDAWKAGDYPAMYQLLTSVSQSALDQEEFTAYYTSVAAEADLNAVDAEILSSLTNPDSAQVAYRVKLTSATVGEIRAETMMNLSLEKGGWRVQWDDTLILPQLKGGNYLAMDQEGYTPSRGNIYDRSGHALVAQADAIAIGLYPDRMEPTQEDELFGVLTELTGFSADTIRARYANFPQGADWYLPLGEVSTGEIANRMDQLSKLSGLALSSYKARYYVDGGVAPHILGFMGSIRPEQLEEYLKKGYRQDDRIGQSGLEAWGEPYLAGKRGGALYVFNAQGQRVTRLAEAQSSPAQAIYTTLERDFQLEVQEAIGSFRGAIVILERDTGRVLAMVSNPGFDLNAFEPVNFNSYTLQQALESQDRPLMNRATQGLYPPGSIFKTITMAAALESDYYTPQSTYQCGYIFTEIEGVQLYDWTYDYLQHDKVTTPSGLLTLPQGLIRSCNPWFYHIGVDFYNRDMLNAIPDMAREFGLGSPTGIGAVDEAAGQVPSPETIIDMTNLSIGQGDLLVTPLQVANFMAAIGNGGTLYQPQIIEKITSPGGKESYSFTPRVLRELPLTPETLSAIQEGLIGVVSSSRPFGTAFHIFTGLDVPVAGKTGTATAGYDMPHAWFAGYTMAEREDRPDIAIAVIAENIGEGSAYAAPIFRRLVEIYFRGQPGKLYPWESTLHVTQTPTPQGAAGEGFATPIAPLP